MTTIRTRSLVFLAVAAWCHVAFADEGVIRVKNSARVTDFNRGNDGDEQKKEKQREFSKSYKNVGMNAPEKFYSFEEHGVYALNQTNFGDDLNPDENWVVEFYAPWCGSCETFKPVYSKIAKDPEYNQDGLKYGAVDCGYSKGVCQVYDIEAMPTLMFFVGELPVVYYGEFKEDAVKEFITGGIGAIEQIRKNLAEQVEQEEKEKEELTIHGEEKLWEMGGSMAVEAAAMQQEYERTGGKPRFKLRMTPPPPPLSPSFPRAKSPPPSPVGFISVF
jgi:thiol-disulfide isomerase/thioredoxin